MYDPILQTNLTLGVHFLAAREVTRDRCSITYQMRKLPEDVLPAKKQVVFSRSEEKGGSVK